MVHPVVQPDQEKVHWVLDMLNANLATDGWEIAPRGEISGKSIFAAHRRLKEPGFAVNQPRGSQMSFLEATSASKSREWRIRSGKTPN